MGVEYLPAVMAYECHTRSGAATGRTGHWLSWAEAYSEVKQIYAGNPNYSVSGGHYGIGFFTDGRKFEKCVFTLTNHLNGTSTNNYYWYGNSGYVCSYNLGDDIVTVGNGNRALIDGEYKCAASKACNCNENLEGSQCIPMEKSNWVSHEPNVTKIYEYPVNNQGQLCPPKEVPERDCIKSNTKFGNPIDCATGQKVQIDTDYQGTGADPLRYTRVYQSPLSDDPNSEPTSGLPWLNISQPGFSLQTFEDGAELGIFTIGHKVKRTFFSPSGGGVWSTNPYMSTIGLTAAAGGGRSVSYKSKVYQLNASGQNEATEDKGIQRYTYSYNAAGLVCEIRNRFGAFLQFTYDNDNRLTRLTDQAGSETHYTYDSHGNLSEVIYPDATPGALGDNPRKTYLYENSDYPYHLTGIIDESGLMFARYEYDENGRGTLTEHADGAERVVISYPEEGQAIVRFYRDTQSDLYREEAYTYSKFRGAYRLTSRTIQVCNDCSLGTETWIYDYQGLRGYKDMRGQETSYTYDDEGRKLSETVAAGTNLARTTRYTWDTDLEKILTITTDA
jgi:YD repeat-containing protein